MFTRDGSKACDERRHADCDGTALWMEQDGPQRLRCGCTCHDHLRWECARAADKSHLSQERICRAAHHLHSVFHLGSARTALPIDGRECYSCHVSARVVIGVDEEARP